MTERIIYGSPLANGQTYMPDFNNRYCAVLSGAMATVADGAGSSSIDWSAMGEPRGDFGRFHDDTLTGGIWFREEGYYLVSIMLTFSFSTPASSGTVEAVLTNSTTLDYVARINVPMLNEYEIALHMTSGDWFARDSYAYLQFNNYSDQSVDCYSQAFVFRVG